MEISLKSLVKISAICLTIIRPTWLFAKPENEIAKKISGIRTNRIQIITPNSSEIKSIEYNGKDSEAPDFSKHNFLKVLDTKNYTVYRDTEISKHLQDRFMIIMVYLKSKNSFRFYRTADKKFSERLLDIKEVNKNIILSYLKDNYAYVSEINPKKNYVANRYERSIFDIKFQRFSEYVEDCNFESLPIKNETNITISCMIKNKTKKIKVRLSNLISNSSDLQLITYDTNLIPYAMNHLDIEKKTGSIILNEKEISTLKIRDPRYIDTFIHNGRTIMILSGIPCFECGANKRLYLFSPGYEIFNTGIYPGAISYNIDIHDRGGFDVMRFHYGDCFEENIIAGFEWYELKDPTPVTKSAFYNEDGFSIDNYLTDKKSNSSNLLYLKINMQNKKMSWEEKNTSSPKDKLKCINSSMYEEMQNGET